MGLIELLLEPVSAEVGDGDEEVHEDGHFDLLGRLLDDLEDGVDDEYHHIWLLLKVGLACARVHHIGQHGSCKV